MKLYESPNGHVGFTNVFLSFSHFCFCFSSFSSSSSSSPYFSSSLCFLILSCRSIFSYNIFCNINYHHHYYDHYNNNNHNNLYDTSSSSSSSHFHSSFINDNDNDNDNYNYTFSRPEADRIFQEAFADHSTVDNIFKEVEHVFSMYVH